MDLFNILQDTAEFTQQLVSLCANFVGGATDARTSNKICAAASAANTSIQGLVDQQSKISSNQIELAIVAIKSVCRDNLFKIYINFYRNRRMLHCKVGPKSGKIK